MENNTYLYSNQINLFYQYLNDEIKNIREYIKSIINNFIIYFKKIKSTNIFNIEKEFEDNKENLIENMIFFRNKLENREEFENEYFIFDEIIDMTNFILNNNLSEIPNKNIAFIRDICDLFFNLLIVKSDLIIKYDFDLNDSFDVEYDKKFIKFFEEYDNFNKEYLENIKKTEFNNLDKLKKHCNFVYEEY